MKKLLSLLCAAVLLLSCFCGCARFKRPKSEEQVSEPEYASGVLLYGASDLPFLQGDIQFKALNAGNYRYKWYGAETPCEKLTSNTDVSSWTKIDDGDVISGTDCRNITVVCTDDKNRVKSASYFEYIPGIIYGKSNPDQYNDLFFYDAENNTFEEERAVKLASNLFRTSDESYYGKEYGYIIQGFLTEYSLHAGEFSSYYHTGTDFTTQQGRPFYAPIGGEIIYAGDKDDYHTIIIYNAEHNVSLLLLHGRDVTPAQDIYAFGGKVEAGALLGYGGGAGNPAGSTHIHVELHAGRATRYQNFSQKYEYTRMGNYDPLILADMFSMQRLSENNYEAFTPISPDAFSAQNNNAVSVVGNWVYFINKQIDNHIIKMRPDGSENTYITNTRAANLVYSDGWIYYSNLDDNGYLYKVNAFGEASQLVAKINCQNYLICIGEKLYFTDDSSKDSLYCVNKDGSDLKQILNRFMTDIFYYNGKFYYTQGAAQKADRIYEFNINTLESKQLLPSRADKPFIINGKLCYRKYYDDKNSYSTDINSPDEANASVIMKQTFIQLVQYKNFTVFTNEADGESLYIKFNSASVGIELCSDLLCKNLTVVGNWIYYYASVDQGRMLCRISPVALVREIYYQGQWHSSAFECSPRLPEMMAPNADESKDYAGELPAQTPDANATPDPNVTPNSNVTPTPGAAQTPNVTPNTTPTPNVTPNTTPEPTPNTTQEPSTSDAPTASPEEAAPTTPGGELTTPQAPQG